MHLLRGYVSFITRMFVIYYVDICIFAVTCGVSFKASTTACWDRVKSTLIPVKQTILPLLIRLVCALRYSYLNCAYLCYLCFDVCRLWSIGYFRLSVLPGVDNNSLISCLSNWTLFWIRWCTHSNIVEGGEIIDVKCALISSSYSSAQVLQVLQWWLAIVVKEK